MRGPSFTSEPRRPRSRSLLVALVAAALLAPAPAYAYIDPMSGSLVLQALAAGALAAVFFFKRFWARVREGIEAVRRRLTGS